MKKIIAICMECKKEVLLIPEMIEVPCPKCKGRLTPKEGKRRNKDASTNNFDE